MSTGASKPRILVCEDSDFRVGHAINPWMDPDGSDPALANKQWHAMLETLKQYADVEVATFDGKLPDEIFWTRDEYAVIKGQIVLASFRHPERQPETAFWRQWFADHGYDTIEPVTTFEGGNIVHHGAAYYVGIGDRAEPQDAAKLSQQFGVEFVGLPVTSDDYFHLDVAMLSLRDAVFYYPGAFTAEALAEIKRRLPDAHELTKDETDGFCANSVAIGDTVIIPAGQASFRAKLEAIGKQVVELDLSAFKPIGGGGVHCLTNSLPGMVE
ncbi:MAG TPA: arginine deiminase-related protein [Candidatus Saccharimonadales bacterium]|nr:arginine deiminase-related protein [Candidatus Saccharimonadales bacterium]